ncbi:MAG: DUF998 domain-containing protein [Thermoproteota archaeon]|nr:DUF998 domain-containing protein [Thermoproteota archaeon]
MPSTKPATRLKIAGICGVASPIVAFTCIFLTISLSPWFNWTKNALSDLGVSETSALFNLGLIISGILILVFAIGLREALSNRVLGYIGASILVLGAISLCGIGIFTEEYGNLHLYVSLAFFILVPISSFLIGASMMQAPSEKMLGTFIILAGIAAIVVWVFPWEGLAIPETISSFANSMWSVILGTKLATQTRSV